MNQLQILQKLSGEKRLGQAFLLSDFTRELALKNIKKNLNKKTTPGTVSSKLQERLSLWH